MEIIQRIWRITRPVLRPVLVVGVITLFYLLRVFPIKKNKVIVCVSGGRRYDDNQKFIIEELHKLCPDIDVVWMKDPRYAYELPSWIRSVKWRSWRWLYEYATAKIWIENNMIPYFFVKRHNQLFIETWHGGLGIKKVSSDMTGELTPKGKPLFMKNVSDMADVFISNSDHLSIIYRRAFRFHGPIWKCGYPKNDMLVQNNPEDGERARRELGIPKTNKVLLYAPTWRFRFTKEQHIDMKVYDLDMQQLKKTLTEKFGGEWTMAIRFHPFR